ncbi:HEAT repeat domain-containing protein [Nannocystis sp. SCPEA4]|uniref:HEAT repeat domain-containing protein n=1 Tax=Nannocystis sp. SCPEA4 TaxID=2996787 RepID=UPI002270B22A|nr:HEAT repeat domain-containing protein [Nannocystis sp. SCPEA4]MCY1061364.1 HEAT repeat domain-containing protein [Nannocystis sp. SCPEA4]
MSTRPTVPAEAAAELPAERREALARAVADPGFTPGRADLRDVVELLAGDDELAVHVERALLRAGAAAGPALLRRLPTAVPPLRPRLVRVLGRLPADPAIDNFLKTCLDDHDPKTRRNAIGALGKRGGPGVAAALLARAREETSLPHLRSLVEALGKAGDADALTWLDGLVADDPELQRLTARARLMLARSLGRGEVGSSIDLDAVAPAPRPLVLACRPGLELLLVDALGPTFAPRMQGPGRVAATLRGPLRELLAVRLWTEVGLPLQPLSRGTDLPVAIAELLTSPDARLTFNTYTKGQPRYRLAWARGGPRRALVWQVAAAAAERWPELVNDPRETTWEVVVDDGDPLRAELRPRRWGATSPSDGEDTSTLEFADPRFAYRSGDVPAASHPTIAAALARLAEVRADDVVWDPFVGSGLELCERGLLGPCAALLGTDLDSRALAVAATNLRNAGLTATLTEADATTHRAAGVTLVITNPPMGRRVHRGDVGPLLTAFVANAAAVLAPGGRLAWISPLPRTTDPAAQAAGLVLRRSLTLDMGGFTGQLQRWDKPLRPARSRGRA